MDVTYIEKNNTAATQSSPRTKSYGNRHKIQRNPKKKNIRFGNNSKYENNRPTKKSLWRSDSLPNKGSGDSNEK